MAHPRLTIGAVLLALAAASGCASAPPPAPSIPQVLEQVSRAGLMKAGEIIEQTLKEQETFGYVAPFAPVVHPPEIRRVWVLTHVSPDGNLVSGHWVYMRLQDWRWFIEAEAAPLRLGSVPAAPAVAPLPSPAAEATPGGPGRRDAPPALPGLPWVEGSPREGMSSPASESPGLEGGRVPTIPIPAPLSPPAPESGPRGRGTSP